ncbi:MAG: hypothetical protein KGO96_01945 [Elusimicrobia bacterium]|nr:hypothetical protein [Elusimicrobiota bacterium]MDE2236311.1 hypothetical protein [Elusimicrobiota bacterium]MDE2424657.1 hypothetical protein [Elusimicrobiota bacterium]
MRFWLLAALLAAAAPAAAQLSSRDLALPSDPVRGQIALQEMRGQGPTTVILVHDEKGNPVAITLPSEPGQTALAPLTPEAGLRPLVNAAPAKRGRVKSPHQQAELIHRQAASF